MNKELFFRLLFWLLIAILFLLLIGVALDIANAQIVTSEAWLDFNLTNEAAKAQIKARNLRLEIGDTLGDRNLPGFKLSAWNEECYLRLGLRTKPTATLGAKQLIMVDGQPGIRIRQDDTVSYEIYRRPDGLEWAIILSAKPTTNRFAIPIQTEGLDFHYQPPLTAEEIAEGCVRPDSVVGSYAVYHSTKRWNRRNVNLATKDTTYEFYGTGKAFHIFRPIAHDALGMREWCDLEITKDSLIVTVPLAMLNFGKYPITIDPTFGQTSAGGSGDNMGNYLRGDGPYTSGSDAGGATVDSIMWYCFSVTSPQDNNLIAGIYTDESPDINPNLRVSYQASSGDAVNFSGDEAGTWIKHINFTGTLSASTAYHFVWLTDTNASTAIKIAYDTYSGIERNSTSGYTWSSYPTLPSDASGYTWVSIPSRRASAYCAYTVSSGGGAVVSRRRRAIILGGDD
ncbi:MAG: hypothetical protein C4570_04275 [Ammonifex sp.]|nr:MAG: hypothetical protein C4570_04275 [Ammonifex sp.]